MPTVLLVANGPDNIDSNSVSFLISYPLEVIPDNFIYARIWISRSEFLVYQLGDTKHKLAPWIWYILTLCVSENEFSEKKFLHLNQMKCLFRRILRNSNLAHCEQVVKRFKIQSVWFHFVKFNASSKDVCDLLKWLQKSISFQRI